MFIWWRIKLQLTVPSEGISMRSLCEEAAAPGGRSKLIALC